MLQFHLKEKRIGKSSPVNAFITGVFRSENYKNERIKIGVGISIMPERFGKKENNYRYDKELVKNGRSHEAILLYQKIKKFKKKYKLLNLHYEMQNYIPTREEYKTEIKKLLVNDNIITERGVTKPAEKNYFDSFIKNCIESDRHSKILKESTIKLYENILKHLLNYQEYHKTRLEIENIKVKTIIDIIDVANQIQLGEIVLKKNYITKLQRTRNVNGYSVEYVNSLRSRLIALLKRVDTDEINLSINFMDARLKKIKSKNAKKLYYDENLLQKIIDHKPLCNRTKRAKEYILVASAFGMRHQSVNALTGQSAQIINNDNGDVFFVVKNEAMKTSITILSPVFKPVQKILDQNDGLFPKFLQLNYLSKAIRDLFEEMAVDDEVEYHEYVYNKGIISSKKKLTEIASSHDCRKSFITNLKKLGVNSDVIRSMTHETLGDDGTGSFNVYDASNAQDRVKTFYESTKQLNSKIYTYDK